MSETSRWINTFVLNAVWQITAISLLAFLCAKLLRRMPSRYAHRAWVLALFASLLIPATTVLMQESAGGRMQKSTGTAVVTVEPLHPATVQFSMPLRSLSHSVYMPPILSRTLPWVFALLLLYGAMRLAWSIDRTSRIRRGAYERQVPLSLSQVAERCVRAFSLPTVPLLCSTEVSSPATLGFRRPVLLLPEAFFSGGLDNDVLLSALAHECAHVQRRDFALNLLYEIVSLAVCFHPFTAFLRSRIAQTRELACDEMAAGMLPSGARYARSLLHIAQSMSSETPLHTTYALGLFDTNALEARIMNILNRANLSTKWARALRLTAVYLVGAVALGISAFSLKLAAENTTHGGQFAGTWECKYKGRTFFTLNLAVEDGALGGTAVHPTRVAWVDGELIPGSDEMARGSIFETHPLGQELLIKIADGPDRSDPITLRFKLIGREEAEVMAVVDGKTAPPPKKPWHFQRVSR